MATVEQAASEQWGDIRRCVPRTAQLSGGNSKLKGKMGRRGKKKKRKERNSDSDKETATRDGRGASSVHAYYLSLWNRKQ